MLGLAGLGVAGPVHADTPGCVSDPEYNATEVGDRQITVNNRFDTSGWLVDTTYITGWKIEHWRYNRCPSPQQSNRVNIEFRQEVVGGQLQGYNRVVDKWRSTT